MKIERLFSNIELSLSKAAAVPIAGTVAGVTKIAFGLVQTVSAIALGLLFALPAAMQFKCAQKHLYRTWIHIKHGFGNMLAGTFEAIPMIGSISYALRKLNCYFDNHVSPLSTRQHGMFFMPYENIVLKDSVLIDYNTPLFPHFHLKKFLKA